MAVDQNSIKDQIDSELANKGYRGIRISSVITILKALADWVGNAVNGNLTTWFRVGTMNEPATNAQDVYRTGKVIVGRANDDGSGAKLQADTATFGTVSTGPMYVNRAAGSHGIRLGSPANGQESWLPFVDGRNYIRGHVILADTLTTDKVGIGDGTPTEKLDVAGNLMVRGILKLANLVANKRITLYDTLGNENQFYGFGMAGGELRYQILSPADAHVFYAGTSPVASQELARFAGNGQLRVGQAEGIAGARLDVSQTNPASGVIAALSNLQNGVGRTGVLLAFHQAGISISRIGVPAGDVEAFVIQGWGGGTYPERMRIDGNGETTFSGPVGQRARTVSAWPSSAPANHPSGMAFMYYNSAVNLYRMYVNNNGTMQWLLFQN